MKHTNSLVDIKLYTGIRLIKKNKFKIVSYTFINKFQIRCKFFFGYVILSLFQSKFRHCPHTFLSIPSNSSSPSLFAITKVATPLPMRLVMARASLINLSTPRRKARPSTGMRWRAVRVEASTMKPLPVTPAAPLEVIIRMPMMLRSSNTPSSTW